MMLNTQCSENEKEGMIFAKSINDPQLKTQNEPHADEAQYLELTERSSKPNIAQYSRSPTIVQPTENAMMVPENMTSYRDAESPERPVDVSVLAAQQSDRPFDK